MNLTTHLLRDLPDPSLIVNCKMRWGVCGGGEFNYEFRITNYEFGIACGLRPLIKNASHSQVRLQKRRTEIRDSESVVYTAQPFFTGDFGVAVGVGEFVIAAMFRPGLSKMVLSR